MRLLITFKPQTGKKPGTLKVKNFRVDQEYLKVEAYTTALGFTMFHEFRLDAIESFETIE